MMRKLFAVALMPAMVCLVGMTRDAAATVTFDLIWTATSGAGPGVGTSTIAAVAGDTITLSLRMTTDEALYLHSVSINFDTDLTNELNLVGSGEWFGSAFGTASMATVYQPLTIGTGSAVESTGAMAGRINEFESGVLTGPLYLPAGTYTIGTAAFQTNTVTVDGADVFVGLFDASVDGVFGPGAIPVSNLVFKPATVNADPVPEPGTLSLLGLSLVGLVLARRHRRRS